MHIEHRVGDQVRKLLLLLFGRVLRHLLCAVNGGLDLLESICVISIDVCDPFSEVIPHPSDQKRRVLLHTLNLSLLLQKRVSYGILVVPDCSERVIDLHELLLRSQ